MGTKWAVVGRTCFALLTLAAPASAQPKDDSREAIRRSLLWLAREGQAWMDGRVPMQHGSKCVSCHHVGFAVWSHTEARRVGIVESAADIDALADRAVEFLIADRGSRVAHGQVTQALASDPRNPAAALGKMLAVTRERQTPAGGWEAQGQFGTQRRTVEESDTVATLWMLLAIRSAGDASDETTATRDRALAWVRDKGVVNGVEGLLTRMLVEIEIGDRAAGTAFLERVLDAQNHDGGWPWTPGEKSNAFSTGQALYALGRSPLDIDSTVTERGVAYLLTRQRDDGTWAVSSASISVKPGSDKDYIYEYWGTAWATLGLIRTLETGQDAAASTAAVSSPAQPCSWR